MPRAVALDGEGPAPSTEAVLATAACGRQSRLSVVGHQNGLKATPHLFHDMRQRETSLQKAAGRPCQVLCLPGALWLWREAAPGVTSWLRPAGRPPAPVWCPAVAAWTSKPGVCGAGRRGAWRVPGGSHAMWPFVMVRVSAGDVGGRCSMSGVWGLHGM